MRAITIFLLLIFSASLSFSQSDSTDKKLDKLRTDSGVDPTRVSSRVSFSVLATKPEGDAFSTAMRTKLTLGVERWSFGLRYEYNSKYSESFSDGIESGSGDILFSVLNAFYVEGKNAFAGSVEFSVPSGQKKFSSEYFSVTPAVVYSYTLSPGSVLAFQPQYTFHIFKNKLYPDLSVFTLRTFLAFFTQSGWFYVIEPRILNDFTNKKFDVIISPVIGKSIGAGFNINLLAEIPVKKETYNIKGPMFLFGISKSF